MKVLVCGGRDYENINHVFKVLNKIHEATPITTVIEGGATGADRWGFIWASQNNIQLQTYPADWRLGKSAGPMRNERMLLEGRPDLVVAFRGGRGTNNMVCISHEARVKVLDLRQEN